jgi:FPC/CPF motif-containing protein YcgG
MKENQFAIEAETAFRQFIARPEFPCLGAKAAFNSESQTLRVFGELASDKSTIALAEALHDFTRSIMPSSVDCARDDRIMDRRSEYATLVAIFERPSQTDEIEFERLLWKQLRLLHENDSARFAWDRNVSADPADAHFSFSFAGEALYVIGLHANSSREARRFPWPTLVFNPHQQFERLRADGKWKHMQETIRERDVQLQGMVNPMLSDFGERSEARQYSGRAVDEDWRAPFPATSGKCPFAH